MRNELSEEALQHIVEKPKHLERMGKQSGSKYWKIAETLKLIERTKALCYDSAEFEREFGKNGAAYLRTVCKKSGINKLRLVKDDDKIYIFSNDERK